MSGPIRGHGRSKYSQSKYSSNFESYENVSDDDYDSISSRERIRRRNRGEERGRGEIYRVQKSKYVRFSPYELRDNDERRQRLREIDRNDWCHDKFDSTPKNTRNNSTDYDNNSDDDNSSDNNSNDSDVRARQWKHDKYDENDSDTYRTVTRHHIHKSSSIRQKKATAAVTTVSEDESMSESDDIGDRAGGADSDDGSKTYGYKVSVKGLSGSIGTIAGLTKLFSKWGRIINCGIERSGSAGYVVYEDKEAAKDAVKLATGTEYKGKKLTVTHNGLMIL